MDIMNTKHTLHLRNIFYHRLDVDIPRRGFKENINGILQDAPGIVKDKKTDQYTDKGVQPIGIRKINDHTRNDCSNSRKHIPHQMDKGRAQVEIMLTAPMDKQRSHKIDNDCNQA